MVGQEQGRQGHLRGESDAQDRAAPGIRPRVAERREAMKDRIEAQYELRKERMENLRDDMSAEDQALFDQLKATIEEQKSEIAESKQELTEALRELRDLTRKYLDLGDTMEDK